MGLSATTNTEGKADDAAGSVNGGAAGGSGSPGSGAAGTGTSDAGGHSKRLSESQGRRAPAKKVPPTSLAEAMINDTEASVMANFDFLAQEGVGIEVDDDDDDLSDDMDDGTDDDNEDQTAAKRSKTKNKVDI